MKNRLINRKLWPIFWATASVMCMIIIFVMSHQPAEVSADMSGLITEWLMRLGLNRDSANDIETIVRKSAHMLEYFGLSLCVTMFVLTYKGRLSIRYCACILGFCVLYAISDEVHQLFIEGRAGQVRDVLIDTSGALLSLVIISVGNYIIKSKCCQN